MIILSDGTKWWQLPARAEEAELVIKIAGHVILSKYPYPLLNLISIDDWADLNGYCHPIDALTMIGPYSNLSGYTYPLPALTSVGRWTNVHNYAHPLPK